MKIKKTLVIFDFLNPIKYDVSEIKTAEDFIAVFEKLVHKKCEQEWDFIDTNERYWGRQNLVNLFEGKVESIESPNIIPSKAFIHTDIVPETYEEHLAVTLAQFENLIKELALKFPDKIVNTRNHLNWYSFNVYERIEIEADNHD